MFEKEVFYAVIIGVDPVDVPKAFIPAGASMKAGAREPVVDEETGDDRYLPTTRIRSNRFLCPEAIKRIARNCSKGLWWEMTISTVLNGRGEIYATRTKVDEPKSALTQAA